ncbi:MAG: rod shape-determining protein MreD [Prevotella sp.]|nr:rod shape-determining protein MreD [Prevotella sp.]
MEHIERVITLVILLLIQVLILNNIHLFQVATPLLYVLFVITFRRGMPKWMILTYSFLLGLLLDIFTNTPGLAAGTMTLIAVIQPYLLETLTPRDSAENMRVSVSTMGFSKFVTFSAILVGIYCVVFFALEAFNFFDWQMWLLRAVSSALLTLLFVLAIESVRAR